MYWDQEAESVLRELWEQGVSSGLIAKEFGCTRNAVIGKVHRLDLPTRQPKMMVHSENPLPEVRRIRKPVYMKLPLPPEPPVEPPSIGGVSLMDLEPHHCRFIVGSSNDGLALYCGHQKVWGTSYCGHHAKLCFNQHVFGKRSY